MDWKLSQKDKMMSEFSGVTMSTVTYASMVRRLAAFILDLPFIIVLYYLCDSICFFFRDAWGTIFDTHIIMYIIIIIVYFCAFEASSLQGTFGKLLLGIQVQNIKDDSRITFMTSLMRLAVKIFSILIFGLGILLIIFTKKHQGLHDLVAGTIVVREK